jgi:DNA mismatch endonuclease, patch repair protein
VVVFVDGDFWHGHGWQHRGLSDMEAQFHHNKDYWVAKIRRNVERDARVSKELVTQGWVVLRIWESDIRQNLEAAAERVTNAVRARTRPSVSYVTDKQTVCSRVAEDLTGLFEGDRT